MIEDKWWARLRFFLFGTWPQAVVRERLAQYDANLAAAARQAIAEAKARAAARGGVDDIRA